MTTEVSRSPLVGSAIDALIDYSVEVCTKPISINPRRAGGRFREDASRYEPMRANGP
jgi:hypothetical protein